VLAVALLFVTTTTLAPAGGLTLAPGEKPPATIAPAPISLPAPDPGPPPPIRLGALAASVAALAQWTRRKAEHYGSMPATAPQGIRIVFVPGHGSEATGTFDDLMDRLGVANEGDLDVVEFDYRTVYPADSHADASRHVSIDDLADGLAAMLTAMALAPGGPIYLVGHSKGAVAISELLARWDRRPALAVDAVAGAALLDPPISGGLLGAGQSFGSYFLPAIPNDGGYSPHHCDGLFDCRDTRHHLGDKSGVEVTVFRNPDALVTNFTDDPLGLRVLDVRDPRAESSLSISAIGTAHSFPLHSAAVAACIADEMRAPGSCNWPIRRWLAGEW